MVKIFSWIIIICILVFVLFTFSAIFTEVLTSSSIFPVLITILLGIVGVCAIGLIITLIFERIKDRKEEEDDLNKY